MTNKRIVNIEGDLDRLALDELKKRAAVFECPPKRCEPNGHVWDGPEYRDENISSATCSKCGMTAFDFSMWYGP